MTRRLASAFVVVLTLCACAVDAVAHPWHSSSGELQWNAEEGVFELALEMDAYHLEEAMSRGVDGWVDLESERAPGMLESMLDEGFRVWTRAVPEDGARPGQWELATPEFIGHEIDDGSAWMYVAFTPEGAGEGRIEAMVRNVFMRGPLPELAVTVRVSGGEPREPAPEDEPLPPGAARGAGVLNFVKADAMAGFRPKEVGVVFRYGLTEEGIARRAKVLEDRAVARAQLGDAIAAALELERLMALTGGGAQAVERADPEVLEATLRAWVAGEELGDAASFALTDEGEAPPVVVLIWMTDRAALSLAFERSVGSGVLLVTEEPAALEELASKLAGSENPDRFGGVDISAAQAYGTAARLADWPGVRTAESIVVVNTNKLAGLTYSTMLATLPERESDATQVRAVDRVSELFEFKDLSDR